MTYRLVRDLAVEGFPVRLTCGVPGFSAQAFYAWNKNTVKLGDLEDAYAINPLIDAQGNDPAIRYRLLADQLERVGIEIDGRRAWRLYSKQKPWFTIVKEGRKGKRSGPQVNDGLLRRDFTAVQRNRKRVTDLSEHPTAEKEVYCCRIKDLFSNRIVGHAVSNRMTADLTISALRIALTRRESDGVVIVHADRESQFRARTFQAVLKAAGTKAPWGVPPPLATMQPRNRSGHCCSATI